MSSSDSAPGQRHNGSHTFGQGVSRPDECPSCWLDIQASNCGDPHCPRRNNDRLLHYAQDLASVSAAMVGCSNEWRPLDDVHGCLTQIDNALTGLSALPDRLEIAQIIAPGSFRPHGTGRTKPRQDRPESRAKALAKADLILALHRLAYRGVKLPETVETPSVDSQSPSPAPPNGLAPNPSGDPL